MKRASRLAALGLAAIVAATTVAAAPGPKPPVPPGRDPGGIAVAIIGTGVDYARADIAWRLARDGEGEVVGFDLIDNDRRPFAPSTTEAGCGDIGCAALPTHLMLSESQATRLAVFRARTGDERMLAGAIGMVAKSPARIVLIDGADASPAVLAAASERFPALLIVAPAGAPAPAANVKALANVFLVTAAAATEPILAPPVDGGGNADLATPAGGRALRELVRCGDPCAPPADIANRLAAARIAALAARAIAVEPQHDGATLARRIADFAKTPVAVARKGFIAEPHRPFWLE